MPESTTDQIQSWLDRFASGDPAAKAALVQIAEGRLKTLTHQILRGFPRGRELDDTTGIFNEAYLRLHEALDAVKPRTPRQFLGLAARKIHQVLLDLVRKLGGRGEVKRGRAVSLDRARDGEPIDVPAPARPEDRSGETLDVYEGIRQLPEHQNEVVMLHHFMGLTFEEIGGLWGLHKDTVRGYWSEAQIALSRILKAYAPEDPPKG